MTNSTQLRRRVHHTGLVRALAGIALVTSLILTGGPLTRAGAAGTSTAPAFAAQSGRQIIADAMVAAKAMGSVTSSSATTISGQAYSLVTEANLTSGQQTLRVGAAKTIVRVIGEVLYLNDNGSDTAIQAQWIEVRSTSSYFAHFNAFILLSSLLSEVAPAGALKTNKASLVGTTPVVGVSGKPNIHLGLASGTETVYVSTLAPHVPVELVASDVVQGQHETFLITFTHWGKRFNVAKPAKSIPISSTNLPS